MSEPKSQVDVEDVLDSIRRLVSTEERVPSRSAGRPAMVVLPGKLVLTEAERVAEDEVEIDEAVETLTPPVVEFSRRRAVGGEELAALDDENKDVEVAADEKAPVTAEPVVPRFFRARATEETAGDDLPPDLDLRPQPLGKMSYARKSPEATLTRGEPPRVFRTLPVKNLPTDLPVTSTQGEIVDPELSEIFVTTPAVPHLETSAATERMIEEIVGVDPFAEREDEVERQSFVHFEREVMPKTPSAAERSQPRITPYDQADNAVGGASGNPLRSRFGMSSLVIDLDEADSGVPVTGAASPEEIAAELAMEAELHAALEAVSALANTVEAQSPAAEFVHNMHRSNVDDEFEGETERFPEPVVAEQDGTMTSSNTLADALAQASGRGEAFSAPLDLPEVEEAPWAAQAEAAVLEVIEAEIEPLEEGIGAAVEAEFGQDIPGLEDLRAMIREMILAELQGDLGQRITRNVRKLVRAEIAMALAAQTLE